MPELTCVSNKLRKDLGTIRVTRSGHYVSRVEGVLINAGLCRMPLTLKCAIAD